MKHLKKFELLDTQITKYYKIIIDKSFDKFEIALDKLGIKDDFFGAWNIRGYDDLKKIDREYFLKEVIYLAIVDKNIKNRNYIIRSKFFDFPYHISDLIKYNYGGEITITEQEVDAKKYNI